MIESGRAAQRSISGPTRQSVAARSAPVGLLVASAWVSLALSGSPAALPQQAVSYGTASESQVSELESEYPGRAYSLNGLFAHPRYGSLAQIPEANLLTYSNSQASLLLRMPSPAFSPRAGRRVGAESFELSG